VFQKEPPFLLPFPLRERKGRVRFASKGPVGGEGKKWKEQLCYAEEEG